MTTDITELAQRMKAAAEKATPGPWEVQFGDEIYATDGVDNEQVAIAMLDARDADFIALANPANTKRLAEALEKAQQERDNWRTSFDNERFRADKLKAHIDDIEPIRAAAEKLVRCKGRYHSEQNYRALAALFGVKTPDLPPLDSESRTVTVKLPEPFKLAKSSSGLMYYYADEVDAALTAAGIKWEAE